MQWRLKVWPRGDDAAGGTHLSGGHARRKGLRVCQPRGAGPHAATPPLSSRSWPQTAGCTAGGLNRGGTPARRWPLVPTAAARAPCCAAYLECNHAQQAALGLSAIEAYYDFTFLDTSEDGLHYCVDCGKVGGLPWSRRRGGLLVFCLRSAAGTRPCPWAGPEPGVEGMPSRQAAGRRPCGAGDGATGLTHAPRAPRPPRAAGRVHGDHPELGQDAHDAAG